MDRMSPLIPDGYCCQRKVFGDDVHAPLSTWSCVIELNMEIKICRVVEWLRITMRTKVHFWLSCH
eukprot:13922370-Ditylum_brightwellii.AAC.1